METWQTCIHTSLDHASITTAVTDVLKHVSKNTRRKEVMVPKSKMMGTPHLGRSSSVDDKAVTFTFDELLDIVKFDLNNAYFRIGDTILQQRVGIPMGSPLSPALAQIVCAWYETQT